MNKAVMSNLQDIVDHVTENELRSIMVLSHDSKFAIAKDGKLIHRDSADMKWFRTLTTGHACVVGNKTYPEVKDLKNRIWVCLTRSGKSSDGFVSDSITHAITFAREIARSKNMNRTVVIAGGAVVYNDAVDKGLPDAIIATVWNCDLGGDKFVNDYAADGRYRLYCSAPLEVVGDVPATVRLYIRAD